MDTYDVPRAILANHPIDDDDSETRATEFSSPRGYAALASTLDSRQTKPKQEEVYMVPTGTSTMRSTTSSSNDTDTLVKQHPYPPATAAGVKCSIAVVYVIALIALLIGTAGLVLGVITILRR